VTDLHRLSLGDATSLAAAALAASGTGDAAARSTAKALVNAEADGHAGHGLSRVPSYAAQVRAGKIDGAAKPIVTQLAAAAVRVDCALGFAYPGIDLAIENLVKLSRHTGIAIAAIVRSHHFGQAGAHVERLAEQGLVAFMFGNSPKAMALWGGKRPMIGTNPIAFAAPLPGAPPLVIDLALSEVARGRIVSAKDAGKSIPEGWAVDADGKPTTDPAAALKGSLLPAGGAKGAALAVMVEILSAAIAGGSYGFEASSLLDDVGAPPNLGQVIFALDPNVLSGGGFLTRMGDLAAAFTVEEGPRMPGTRRLENRARAARDGVAIPVTLHEKIMALSKGL